MDPQGDAERRIADLQHQLDQERRIAELQRQLDEARSERPDFGGVDWTSPGAPADTRLSAAPRSVPLRFVLAELLPFRWWYLTALFLVAVPAAIVWVTVPAAALPVAVLTLVSIYAVQLSGTASRLRLLKWGRVATVTGTEIASRASYYGGVTWYNAPLPVARGWRVSRPLWSGPSTKTLIRYTLGDYRGELSVRGREYVDGVILADQRHPDRAKCVTFFPYDLDRDDAGDWTGRLRARLVIGMAVWLVIVIAWLLAAAAITTGYATRALQRSQMITIEPGGTAQVSGSRLTREVTCHGGGGLTVDGTGNVVTVSGHCTNLTVTGLRNTVTIDGADTIAVSGIHSQVVYHSGTPTITITGIDDSAVRG